jgi:hypothetical protein
MGREETRKTAKNFVMKLLTNGPKISMEKSLPDDAG